jgi:predicted negative regulator of RcsB-dependent stress response
MAKMRTLSQDAAAPLNNYLKNYRGVNLEKDTYLSLGYLNLLKGNTAGYQTNIELVRVKGYDYHDRDKQALKEAGYPAPDKDLLKARLLFDGGYYDAALKELADKKSDDFKLLRDKIEYTYRLGRIYDAKDRDDVAVKFYQYAINMGSKQQYYFASNAALRIGVIYEKKKDAAKARQYFNTAISMKDHDYENSIENKAKEGLRRLK